MCACNVFNISYCALTILALIACIWTFKNMGKLNLTSDVQCLRVNRMEWKMEWSVKTPKRRQQLILTFVVKYKFMHWPSLSIKAPLVKVSSTLPHSTQTLSRMWLPHSTINMVVPNSHSVTWSQRFFSCHVQYFSILPPTCYWWPFSERMEQSVQLKELLFEYSDN